MALSKRELFEKRRMRVRNKLRKANAGRVRLSVHRSNRNISAPGDRRQAGPDPGFGVVV